MARKWAVVVVAAEAAVVAVAAEVAALGVAAAAADVTEAAVGAAAVTVAEVSLGCTFVVERQSTSTASYQLYLVVNNLTSRASISIHHRVRLAKTIQEHAL